MEKAGAIIKGWVEQLARALADAKAGRTFQEGWAASVKIEFMSKYSALPIDWVVPFSPRAGTSNGPFILGMPQPATKQFYEPRLGLSDLASAFG